MENNQEKKVVINSLNTLRSFTEIKEGTFNPQNIYVYFLRDPRDKKIFYVGQGINNRVFSHFDEADYFLKKTITSIPNSKIARIIDIWNNDFEVEWFIAAHNLEDIEANKLEAAIIDTLDYSQNGKLYNLISGPSSSFLSSDDIKQLNCQIINPSSRFIACIFNITNSLKNGVTPYNATRSAWSVSKTLQKQTVGSIAFGVISNIIKDGFEIQNWVTNSDGKQEFHGIINNTYNQQSLRTIINKSKGYWGYGNYLVVEFDGKGKFRFLYGNSDKTTWFTI
jgi:hypothetical protein